MARDNRNTKGWMKNNVTGELVSFQYNPSTFEYSRGATYAEIASPGMSYPLTQFVRGNIRVFPLELFMYDNPSTGVIKKYENFLKGLVPPEKNGNYTKPPDFLFCYGSFIKKCVLDEYRVVYERVDKNKNPLQATVSLTLRQVGE